MFYCQQCMLVSCLIFCWSWYWSWSCYSWSLPQHCIRLGALTAFPYIRFIVAEFIRCITCCGAEVSRHLSAEPRDISRRLQTRRICSWRRRWRNRKHLRYSNDGKSLPDLAGAVAPPAGEGGSFPPMGGRQKIM